MGKKDFVNYSPDSGNGNGILNVTADANTSGASRSTILDVAGGSVSKSLNVSQLSKAINFTQQSRVVFIVRGTNLDPSPQEAILVEHESYYDLTIEATYYLDFGIGTGDIRLIIGIADDNASLTESGDVTHYVDDKSTFLLKNGSKLYPIVKASSSSQAGTPPQFYLNITCSVELLQAYIAGAVDKIVIDDCYRLNGKPITITLANFAIIQA